MSDWDLLTPGIGLTSIGIVGVVVSLSGIAKTFIDGMHAVSLLTMFIGMIFLASGLFKDGFPSSGRAKSATFITLGFLVTFGFAGAVTVSVQVPSIYAYIGLMIIIAIPATVLAVASFRRIPYIKALAVIFIGASIVGGTTFYAFGLVTPRAPEPEEGVEGGSGNATSGGSNATAPAEVPAAPANIINATILAGASAQGNPDYEPDPLTVNKGDGVQWTNEDNTPHTVTSREEGLFDSSIISAGDTWLLNTAELDAGEYEYFCTLHPNMVGVLNVVEGGAPAAPAEGGSGNATSGGSNATAPAEGNQSSETADGNQSTTGAAPGNQSTGAPANGGATVTTVAISVGASVPTNNEFYVPETVGTTVGSMVTWRNDDTAIHTATSGVVENNAPSPDGKFDSGFLNKGQTFSFVFEEAGDYPYYCTVHPFMTGHVTVN
jgi:plastocyanin